MTRFLVGQALLILAVILGITLIGGRMVTWLHPAAMALVFVLAVPLLAVLSAHSHQELRQAFADALQSPAPSRSRATSLQVWRLLESFLYFGGAIALLTGLIITFSFLNANLPLLGMKLAATLVAPFYGLMLALTCRILRARVERATCED